MARTAADRGRRPLKGQRVLITGASGFVGPHLARALKVRGARISGLGPEAVGVAADLEAWYSADVTRFPEIESVLVEARPQAIVHLAGQSSAGWSFQHPVETFRANVTGTWNLLEALRRSGSRARTLIVSTGEVYGPQPSGTRVREEAHFRPVSPYALSKATADRVAGVYASDHGLDVVRTRSFGHIGPGQTPRFVVPAIAEQIAAIEAVGGEPVLRVGNLEVTRDLTDVRDVVEAYVALLERGRSGTAYNVCRGEGVTLTEVVRMLCEKARVPVRVEVDPARMRPADVRFLVGDPGAIRREAGWEPRIPLDVTLDDVLEEWRGRQVERGR